MPKMAHHVRIEQRYPEKHWSFMIDGEEFPWYVAEGGISYEMCDGVPIVKLSLLADKVEIIDDSGFSDEQKAVG